MNQVMEQWTNLHIAIKTFALVFLWSIAIAAYYFMYYQEQYFKIPRTLVDLQTKATTTYAVSNDGSKPPVVERRSETTRRRTQKSANTASYSK